jgi:hypothetical protein
MEFRGQIPTRRLQRRLRFYVQSSHEDRFPRILSVPLVTRLVTERSRLCFGFLTRHRENINDNRHHIRKLTWPPSLLTLQGSNTYVSFSMVEGVVIKGKL